MNKTSIFKKISELSNEDRSKLKGYWSELWGNEFAKALVTDFEPSGDMKKVKAMMGSKRRKYAAYEDLPGMNEVKPPTPSTTTKDLTDQFNTIIFDLMSNGIGMDTLRSMLIEADRNFKSSGYQMPPNVTANKK